MQQPADHVRWDLLGALLVKLVSGREFKPIIDSEHGCRHAGADERGRLNHRGAGKAPARMTIVQPKERHSLKCSARYARLGGRQAVILIIAAPQATGTPLAVGRLAGKGPALPCLPAMTR